MYYNHWNKKEVNDMNRAETNEITDEIGFKAIDSRKYVTITYG
jgi:hypothetical protein